MSQTRMYEVPFVITVEGTSREDAVNEASDLADSISEVFSVSATAIVADDHNIFDRLGIKREGEAA